MHRRPRRVAGRAAPFALSLELENSEALRQTPGARPAAAIRPSAPRTRSSRDAFRLALGVVPEPVRPRRGRLRSEPRLPLRLRCRLLHRNAPVAPAPIALPPSPSPPLPAAAPPPPLAAAPVRKDENAASCCPRSTTICSNALGRCRALLPRRRAPRAACCAARHARPGPRDSPPLRRLVPRDESPPPPRRRQPASLLPIVLLSAPPSGSSCCWASLHGGSAAVTPASSRRRRTAASATARRRRGSPRPRIFAEAQLAFADGDDVRTQEILSTLSAADQGSLPPDELPSSPELAADPGDLCPGPPAGQPRQGPQGRHSAACAPRCSPPPARRPRCPRLCGPISNAPAAWWTSTRQIEAAAERKARRRGPRPLRRARASSSPTPPIPSTCAIRRPSPRGAGRSHGREGHYQEAIQHLGPDSAHLAEPARFQGPSSIPISVRSGKRRRRSSSSPSCRSMRSATGPTKVWTR